MTASRQSLIALDCFSFCLGDLSAGMGLYLAVYLLSQCHWDHASIGIALSALPIAAIIAQIPAGILVDRVYQKRLIAVISLAILAVCCLSIIFFHSLIQVITIQSIAGISLSILTTAIIAISLGLVSKKEFSARAGRNGAFNNFGNVIIALCAGALGYFVSQISIFILLAAIAVACIFFVLMINEKEIDHARARGNGEQQVPSVRIWQVLSNKTIIIFAVTLGVWQLANSALCPTAAQYIAETHSEYAGLSMPACILAGQLVMIPMAILTGKFAHLWGRKPLLLIAFAVLPIRALLYTFTSNPIAIIAIQLLDGVGAGILIVLTSIIAGDLAEGTGRYNVTRSMALFTQGLGIALSNLLAGWLISKHGYNFTFTTLAIIAVFAFLLCQFAMPETYKKKTEFSR